MIDTFVLHLQGGSKGSKSDDSGDSKDSKAGKGGSKSENDKSKGKKGGGRQEPQIICLTCPFCRKSQPENEGFPIEEYEARMALGDHKAFANMSNVYSKGLHGLPRDKAKASTLRLRAFELGSLDACYNMSLAYSIDGRVEGDASKAEYYLKMAARQGHIQARYRLACLEKDRDNIDLAVKHWMISAAAGHEDSAKNMNTAYRYKYITKNQFENVLRAYQKAKEDMSSEERDKAIVARDAIDAGADEFTFIANQK